MVYGCPSLLFVYFFSLKKKRNYIKRGESSLFMLEVYVLNTVPVITYLDVISDRDKILNENRGNEVYTGELMYIIKNLMWEAQPI
jgi:hypothetical protein